MSTLLEQQIAQVQQQISVSDEAAKAALQHTNGNVVEAILHLYQIPPVVQKTPTEWDERREICQSFEEGMQTYLQSHSTLQMSNNATIRSIALPKKGI